MPKTLPRQPDRTYYNDTGLSNKECRQPSSFHKPPSPFPALYAFKEELEQSEDKQAKEVLVDVDDLLDFKKDAYELLCQIGNRSDKKTLKRLVLAVFFANYSSERSTEAQSVIPQSIKLYDISGTWNYWSAVGSRVHPGYVPAIRIAALGKL